MAIEKRVQVDSRGRVTLGDMAHHEQYIARVEADDKIVMEPAVVQYPTEPREEAEAMVTVARMTVEPMVDALLAAGRIK